MKPFLIFNYILKVIIKQVGIFKQKFLVNIELLNITFLFTKKYIFLSELKRHRNQHMLIIRFGNFSSFYFFLLVTGIITLLKPLNIDNPNNSKTYSLGIEARDNGNNTSTYMLTVFVRM